MIRVLPSKKYTRLTVVDETGRVYERFDVHLELQEQDDARTLKVFVRSREFLQQPVVTDG